jgi:DNA-binding NtrC family response regulator
MAVELKDSVGSTPSLAEGKVLLVDDEPELRRVFRRSLARAGFEVVEAADGQMALELVRQGEFDAVISDVCMPKLGGLGLLDRLHVEAPLLPVVLISGSAGFVDVSALDYGAFDYLPKPVSLIELRNCVANAVTEHRRRLTGEREEQRVSETRLIAAVVSDFRKASA